VVGWLGGGGVGWVGGGVVGGGGGLVRVSLVVGGLAAVAHDEEHVADVGATVRACMHACKGRYELARRASPRSFLHLSLRLRRCRGALPAMKGMGGGGGSH